MYYASGISATTLVTGRQLSVSLSQALRSFICAFVCSQISAAKKRYTSYRAFVVNTHARYDHVAYGMI